MMESDRKNWRYLVAAVQSEQGSYVNAKATRYARAIVAVNKELDILETGKKVDSISVKPVVLITRESE